MVDSADRDRLPISKAELLSMLSEDELKDARLLVFANKQVSQGSNMNIVYKLLILKSFTHRINRKP